MLQTKHNAIGISHPRDLCFGSLQSELAVERSGISTRGVHLEGSGTIVDSDTSAQRKCFWLLLMLLSLGAIFLPLGWGVVETLASAVISWWIVYRSGIF
jgi:hypothetical protein